MSNQYPENVINKILQITLETQTFAYIVIDNQGILMNQGGNLEALGLPAWSLQDNIIDDVLFLSGYIPMSRYYEMIPSLHITDSVTVDAHLFNDLQMNWVILVDKTEDLKWQDRAGQKANELQLLQQQMKLHKEGSKELPDDCNFEFFEALNVMALTLNKQGMFDLLKPVSEDFQQLYPEAFISPTSLQPERKFPFIENFLIDAKQLWGRNINRQRISSGPWIESFKDGGEIALEARAINWNDHKLLFIEIIDTSYQRNHQFLQLGRESVLQKYKLEQEVRKQTANIRYLVTHDTLTDLPNRYSLQQRLGDAVKNANRHKQKFSLLFIDLDDFKGINDSLGHDIGDELLKAISTRIALILRDNDFAARLGGDEFCILVEEIIDAYDAAQVADRCLEVISEPIVIEGYKLQPRASVGITIYPDDGQNPEQLLSAADIAMYAAKQAGRHQYAFYTPELTQLAAQRMSLENDLRHAIKTGEFKLFYQPQISLSNGKMTGIEALIRWPHPERGMVQPNEFIHVAERIGLISELGEWVLRTACEQAIAWQQAGVPPFRVAVNISGSHFQQGTIVSCVTSLLEETGLAPALLELEITEDVVQTTEQSIETFTRLKELGVTIAIDDFGTGYSSLSSLKYLPIDCLKIDRVFIMDALSKQSDSVIIATVIAMGQALGLSVLAEGVETIEQVNYLHGVGCEYVQGFYFSKPVPAEQIPGLAEKCFVMKT